MEDVNVQSTEVVNEPVSVVTEEVVPEIKPSEEPVEKPIKPGDIEYTNKVKKRIDKITFEKIEAQKEADRLRAEVEKLRTVSRPEPPLPTSYIKEDGTIDNDTYKKDLTKYEDTLEDWRSSKKEKETFEIKKKAEFESKFANFQENAAPLKEKYPDFDEVIEKPVFGEVLREVLLENDNGPDLAYYLGKNEKEAARINAMQPYDMMYELGKLEEKLTRIAKTTSKAPDPITPLDGIKGTAEKKMEDMSDDEWIRWRREQKLKKMKLK